MNNVHDNSDSDDEPVHIYRDAQIFRATNPKNVIIAHININSLRHKVTEIHEMLTKNFFDVLAISETKLDDSFTNGAFNICNYKMYRQDRNKNGGGILFYVKDTLPHRMLIEHSFMNEGIECLTLQVVMRNKLNISCLYKPPNIKDDVFSRVFSRHCESLTADGNVNVFIGDFNYNMLEQNLLCDMCDLYGLVNMIKTPTCFKAARPTLLDVILTNEPRKFHNTLNADLGVSDFHNFVGVSTKMHHRGNARNKITYRSFRHFDSHKFSTDIEQIPFSVCKIFDDIDDVYWAHSAMIQNVVNEHAPIKTKVISGNRVPFMNGKLRRAIHQRNMWRNRHFRDKGNPYLRHKYTRARNYVVSLTRKSTKQYFVERCTGGPKNDNFWATIKPFLSDKGCNRSDKIILKENDTVVTDSSEIATIFNMYYTSVAQYDNDDDSLQCKTLDDIITKHENNASILSIKAHMDNRSTDDTFKFTEISETTVIKHIRCIGTKKAAGWDGINVKVMKAASQSLSAPTASIINDCLLTDRFPTDLKRAVITPVYKKKDNLCKENYRSVNVLPVFSKVFERIIADQLLTYFTDILDTAISAYRKGYNCQHVLLSMLEHWRDGLDNHMYAGGLAMDLSKAFDYMPHGLLIAKLHAYGVSPSACKFIMSYLTDRLQQVKVSGECSDLSVINRGVPQGSVLGPLLFNLFMNDLFYVDICSEVFNYADDNTLGTIGESLDTVARSLSVDAETLLDWFANNHMEANPGKFQGIVLGRNASQMTINMQGHDVTLGNSIEVLGVVFDNKLNFRSHVDKICKKACRQLNVLKRVGKHIDESGRLAIYKSFIRSNFSYCPVVWCFCNKSSADKIEQVQERALRFVTRDYDTAYPDLLDMMHMDSQAMYRMKCLIIEIYKCVNGVNPEYLNKLLCPKDHVYMLRDTNTLVQNRYGTKTYGYKSFQYFGAKLWNSLPLDVKECDTVSKFKARLDVWSKTQEGKALLMWS